MRSSTQREEIGIDTVNSYSENISGAVVESEEASHLGSFLNIEVAEDQTYYIGVSQLAAQQDYNPTKIDGRSTNSTVNEGSYQIHIDYQPNFSYDADFDGYIGATAIADIDLSSSSFNGSGTIGVDTSSVDLQVGPSDIDYFRIFFDRDNQGNATSTNSRILSVEAKGVEATPQKLDVALDLYTLNDAGSEYLRVNGNDNKGDVSVTDPNDVNRDAHFSASINPGKEYFLAVRGSGNEIVNPENLSHSVAGSTGAYTFTASLAAAVTGRGNSTLSGFLNNSVSYDGSDLATLKGSTFDLDLIADSLEATGITTGPNNTAVELDSPVVPSTGLIFEGEIGADGGENSHPFAALYRAELGLDGDAPVRSDFVGADDIDLFRFSIAQAGSYELSTKILGDSTQQADPEIRLFKADGSELTSSASLEHPSQGLTEQLVIQLAAGDYIAMLSGEGAATNQKLKLDTSPDITGSQPASMAPSRKPSTSNSAATWASTNSKSVKRSWKPQRLSNEAPQLVSTSTSQSTLAVCESLATASRSSSSEPSMAQKPRFLALSTRTQSPVVCHSCRVIQRKWPSQANTTSAFARVTCKGSMPMAPWPWIHPRAMH